MSDRNDRAEHDSSSQVPDLESVNGSVNHAEFADFDDEAADLAMVHADDEYLDRLGGATLGLDDSLDLDGLDDLDGFGDDQLSELLLSWRRDVDSEPIGELVDPKLATMTVQAARLRRKRRPRLLVPIAAAAAVLAIAFAGVGLAARDAQPGDTLWALTKVLYADHARSVEAAQAVRADLREAEVALTEGNVAVAKSKLEDAHATLPTVSTEDGQADLEAQHASLMAQLPGNPSGEPPLPPSANPTTVPNPGTEPNPGGGSGSSSSPTEKPEDTSPSTPPDSSDTSTSPAPSETTKSDTESPSGEGEGPAGLLPPETTNAPVG